MAQRLPFLANCRRRYGAAFKLRLFPFGEMVVISEPSAVRRLFASSADRFNPVGDNLTAFFIGGSSVGIVEGPSHLQLRRALMPPVTGERLRAHEPMIARIVDEAISQLPVGKPIRWMERLDWISMQVILRIIFGITDAPSLTRITELTNEFMSDLISLRALPFFVTRRSGLTRPLSEWTHLARTKRRVDQLIYAKIAESQARPGVRQKTDVLSLLNHPPAGQERLSPLELRDQLATFLAAGFKTTAMTMGWAFIHVLGDEAVKAKLIRAVRPGDGAPQDHDYVDAIVKETLRLRPVIGFVLRRLTEPLEVAGIVLPKETRVAVGVSLLHRLPELYERPDEFIPERFVGHKPEAWALASFGGGDRRCLGASLAMVEIRVVLERMFARLKLRAETVGDVTAFGPWVLDPPKRFQVIVDGIEPSSQTPDH